MEVAVAVRKLHTKRHVQLVAWYNEIYNIKKMNSVDEL